MNQRNLNHLWGNYFGFGLAILLLSAMLLARASRIELIGPVRGAEDGAVLLTFCPPLPPPSGFIIDVDPSQAAQLDDIVAGAKNDETIALADGAYHLNGDYLRFAVPGVTLRSASGNREAVIIDGGYQTTEIVQVVASNVTIDRPHFEKSQVPSRSRHECFRGGYPQHQAL